MFNALKYIQELEHAGFSREQAEVSVKILIEVMNDNFATKSDLFEVASGFKSDFFEVESRLKSDLAATKAELKSDIKTLESSIRELDYKLTIKLGVMLTAAVGITATLIRLLPH